ncbi:MAG: hypothetical protein KIT00_09035, partial [Rhodospirillales bacterium]|nr:hypothetical protein [Rhodospirillales bacterium]
LSAPKEPYELELPYGIRVTVRPLTSASMAACQSAARRRIESLESQVRERKESGLGIDDLPDLDDPAERDGLYHGLLVHELAARHIVSWSGVLDADGESEAPVTREAVAAVVDLYPVGERFFQEFTLKQVLLNAAKNASGLSAAGTSGQVEGPIIAAAAVNKEPPASGVASA